jgi:integrase
MFSELRVRRRPAAATGLCHAGDPGRVRLRRAELAKLPIEKIQIRQGHWGIVDLVGKGGHLRTIPIPTWAKERLDRWTSPAKIGSGRVFRPIRKNGVVWGEGISENLVWHVVNKYCSCMGLEHVAPHELAGPALSCATLAAANWNRFSCCSAMSRCRPRSAIWVASRI